MELVKHRQSDEAKDQQEVENKPFTEIKTEAEKCKQSDWVHEGHAIKANMTSLSQTQSPIWFFKDGNFQQKQVIVKIKPLHDQNYLHLIKDHLVQEAHNLRQLKSPHCSGISFLLGLGKEPVQRLLITAYQRFSNLLKFAKERNTYWQIHTNTAEDHRSLAHSSNMLVSSDDPKSSSVDLLLQLCCEPVFEEPGCFAKVTTTPSNENVTVRNKWLECSKEHRSSTPSDFWVLTYIFRPTRKILFVYVADRRDVFPHESCSKDEEYELLTQCLQWPLCRHYSSNVKKRLQEINEVSELEQPTELPLNSHLELTDKTEEVCKKQSPPRDGQSYDSVGKQCSKNFSSDLKLMQVERNSIDPQSGLNEIDDPVSQRSFRIQSVNDGDPSNEDSRDDEYDSSMCQLGDALETRHCRVATVNYVQHTAVAVFASLKHVIRQLKVQVQIFDRMGGLIREYSADDLVWAINTSSTSLSLTIDDSILFLNHTDWITDLADGLANNTSLTTLSLAFNISSHLWMSRDWAKCLGDVLRKNTSLTTLTLTINNNSDLGMSGDWAKVLGDGLAKNMSLTALAVTIINSRDLWRSGNWAKGLGDGLARNTSLTTLSLTFNNSNELQMSEDFLKGLGDGLARNTSLTSLAITISNSSDLGMRGHWAKGLAEGLAKNMSLATLSLTVNNSSDLWLSGGWAKCLGDVLGKNTSLTTLALTITNSSDLRKSGNWAKGLGDGLAKHTSLTTLALTISNRSDLWMSGNWSKGLGDGLVKNTSLTTLTLTINNSGDLWMSGDWGKGLGDGLAKNTSLTTLAVTVNNSSDLWMSGNWAKGLGDGLAKNTSLTTLAVTINNSSYLWMSGDWGKGLGDGLAKNTSLTTLTLTITNSSDLRMSADWAKGLGNALAKNTSLTSLSLTFNNSSELSMSGDWAKVLGDGLAENTSLATLNLAINNSSDLWMSGDWAKGLGDGLAKNTFLTTLSLTISNSRNLKMSGDLAKGLGDGLAKNTSLTTLTLTINSRSELWMSEDWARDLETLAKRASLTALSVAFNRDSFVNEGLAEVMSEGLAKSTSSTAITPRYNNDANKMKRCNSVCGRLVKSSSLCPRVNYRQARLHWHNNNKDKSPQFGGCSPVVEEL